MTEVWIAGGGNLPGPLASDSSVDFVGACRQIRGENPVPEDESYRCQWPGCARGGYWGHEGGRYCSKHVREVRQIMHAERRLELGEAP